MARFRSQSGWLAGLTIAVSLAGAFCAKAAAGLFDFESPRELAALHDEGKTTLGGGKTLEREEQFATSGRYALRFATPKWRAGLPQWPAFEADPPLTNWAGYDRLFFEVTNPGEQAQTLSVFVTDSKVPTRSGLHHRAELAPFSYTAVVVPLAGLGETKVNPAQIRRLHFYTAEPPGDMAVFLDRLVLLEPGENPPAVPASYLRQFSALASKQANLWLEAISGSKGRMKEVVGAAPVLEDWARRSYTALEHEIGAFRTAAERGDSATLQVGQALSSFRGTLERLESLIVLRSRFEQVRPQVQAAKGIGREVAVGFATSMDKVLPRSVPVSATISERVDVKLARNEKESFQVLVIPFEQGLERVQVRPGDLRSADGGVLPSSALDAAPVGYVETKATPPYGSAHVGWWPDPILDFMNTADIAAGDAQSFWVRVRCPREQPPGMYRGELAVLADGAPMFSFDLQVRVYPFELPDRSPLPLAITFAPHDHPPPETKDRQAEWRQTESYPINAWRKHKLRWADFLADYYITYDSLYHSGMPDPEVLERLHRQGRLGHYNLGYYGYPGAGEGALEKWKASHLPRLRAAYDKSKELGVLDHAYIYGCDEAAADLFPRVQAAAEILQREFTGVPIMTTTYDHSFGADSVIKAVDAFCPLTPRFDPAKAAAARTTGRQVWWYICCGPHHPHANLFIEYPAIEGRILMGAMTAKYRPDGFLYYQISIWNSKKPIEGGPFTDWDPRSWTGYHGDGSWTCVGPDGTPLATIRLENFRDGLEDYAYARLLDDQVNRVEKSSALREQKAAWLKSAKALLAVPAEVLKSKTEYTLDPAAVYRWRDALAEAILTADSK